MWPPYVAKHILLLISVLSVLFYWLHLSLDGIKMMCGCSSQVTVLDVPAAILDNSFKTSTPFIDTVISETLWEFLPLGDYRSLQFFHRLELSLVVDSLLKSTPNSVIYGRQHDMRLNCKHLRPILAVVFVLVGVVGGRTSRLRALKFILVTVKEWLKSVLNYWSYPKNKTGYPFFWTTRY